MKGAKCKFLVFIITMLIFCSFSFPAYAASDWYDDELFSYEDSYVSPKSSENRVLYFLPIIPETAYHNYFIFKHEDSYFAYVADPGLGDSFYVYNGDRIINYEEYQMFKYEIGVSNDWEAIEGGAGFYNRYPGMVVIDTTKTVQTYGVGSPVIDRGIVNHSSYRIYWTLALIEKQILAWLSRISDFVLQHELLHYVVFVGFAGEIILFVFMLIRRVGELKDEEAA